MSRTLLVMASAVVISTWTVSLAQTDVASSSRRKPLVARHLSLLGFTLGKSTLDDVRAKLGDSKVQKCSREEEASDEICYVGPDRTKVVFEAGFSGGWTELDGYKIISAQLNPHCYRQCPATSIVSSDTRTEGGLRLGLTRHRLMKLLGKPTRATRNKLTFEWQSRLPMTTEEIEKSNKTFSPPAKDAYWDVVDTIEVTLSNGRVVEVAVHHTVTD